MPWNEPGGSNKDPWGGRRPGDQGPPDLDELLRKLSSKFGGIFGGGGGGGGGLSRGGSIGALLIIVAVLLLWAASGFFIVQDGQRGVVLRFGKFEDVAMPGLNWHIPYPVESVETVDVAQVRSAQHKAVMLTEDENIVEVDLATQYRVKNAEDYVFQVRAPDMSLRQAMESAVREVVGKSKMDFILGEGRSEIAASTKAVMQVVLDDYRTGLDVLSVNLQDAQPPEAVQGSFADAIKAREDEVRFRNEAEAYANTIIPQARGEAARFSEEANAYKEQVIARAEGDVARFEQLLIQYEKAPTVTRDRLYLDAVENVLSNSGKIVVDVDSGSNLLYLPLDRLLQAGSAALAAGADTTTGLQQSRSSATLDLEERQHRSLRAREVR